MIRRLTPFGVIAAVLAAIGCGDSLRPYPVRGQVFYRDAPAWGAVVTFVPKSDGTQKRPQATATVGKDGTFRLSTNATFDGAAAGDYAVTIVYPSPEKKLDEVNVGPDLLQGKYADPKTTTLKAEVKPIAENVLEAFRFN